MTFVLLNSLLKEEKYIYNFEAVITIIFKIIYRNKKIMTFQQKTLKNLRNIFEIILDLDFCFVKL